MERVEGAGLVGTSVHLLIQLLAERGGPAPAVADVIGEGRAFVGHGRSPSARQALRVAVITLTCVYVRQFWPLGGRLIASELIVGDAALDLLWLLADGRLQAHELKTGMFAGPAHEPTVMQARRQAEQASALLGASFSGVRVALLRWPDSSFHVDPAGTLTASPGSLPPC